MLPPAGVRCIPLLFSPPYCTELGDTDSYPGRFEFRQTLRDMFGQGFEQREMFMGKHFLDASDDKRIVQRILKVIRITSPA